MTKSTTDPDCGVFVRGKHQQQFAYEAHTACDKNGYVLETVVTPGNVHDCVICPEYQPLAYHTTNRDGYREYCSAPKICAQCPTRELCTRSKNCVKTVLRHVWKDYEELADDARYTPEYKELYAKRKETIERVFADAKEKHGMRYTLYRGLAQVSKWARLKEALNKSPYTASHHKFPLDYVRKP